MSRRPELPLFDAFPPTAEDYRRAREAGLRVSYRFNRHRPASSGWCVVRTAAPEGAEPLAGPYPGDGRGAWAALRARLP